MTENPQSGAKNMNSTLKNNQADLKDQMAKIKNMLAECLKFRKSVCSARWAIERLAFRELISEDEKNLLLGNIY